jgi:hypothetical protein
LALTGGIMVEMAMDGLRSFGDNKERKAFGRDKERKHARGRDTEQLYLFVHPSTPCLETATKPWEDIII